MRRVENETVIDTCHVRMVGGEVRLRLTRLQITHDRSTAFCWVNALRLISSAMPILSHSDV